MSSAAKERSTGIGKQMAFGVLEGRQVSFKITSLRKVVPFLAVEKLRSGYER